MENNEYTRRIYGAHLTPIEIFNKYILPEIQDKLYNYVWVDLFCGEGNLILPILNLIPKNERMNFFKEHIYLFDIQEDMIAKAIQNAINYGIPEDVASKNIIKEDTLKSYPKVLFNLKFPIYHITNPPYLYKGYIAKKEETRKYLEYFKGNKYQDLYQLAMINDLKNNIQNMIYIIPSNFLFGFSVSNQIRTDFLKYYNIKKAIIFEKKIFEYTGTNVMIAYFERKKYPNLNVISFEGTKINGEIHTKVYKLYPKNHYRAGGEFEEFVNKYKARKHLEIKYYLTIEDIEKNKGDIEIELIDANKFINHRYAHIKVSVNEKLYNKIKSNILFVRTVDTGSENGRVGIFKIRDIFGVDGILVSKAKYRTHPIQIFIEPELSLEDQELLMNYFNLLLEYFREKTDGEFLTTYKYSDSGYTRKYLGLSQTKRLIETFPILELNQSEKNNLKQIVKSQNIDNLISFLTPE